MPASDPIPDSVQPPPLMTLPMPAIGLTAEHLKIPRLIAQRYAACCGRISLDELISEGNLALIRAWHAFDPALAHGGAANFGPFATQRVEWGIRNYLWPDAMHRKEWRHRAVRSLDACRTDDDQPYVEILPGREPDPAQTVETAELAELVLARLPDRERELVHASLAMKEDNATLGKRFSISRERVRQLLHSAEVRLRRSFAATPHPLAPSGTITWHARPPARRAQGGPRNLPGGLRREAWYLLDHTHRTIRGPWWTPSAALAVLGIAFSPRRRVPNVLVPACLGWPQEGWANAVLLDALADGQPRSWESVAGLVAASRPNRPALSRVTTCKRLPILAGRGLLQRRPDGSFAITPESLSRRGPVAAEEPMLGVRALACYRQGWTVTKGG